MRRPLACLAVGLAFFIMIGWGAGALWTSIVGSGDLEFVQEVARQRSTELTAVAKGVTWAGSAFLLVPLALVCCVVLVRAGLRWEAVAVAVSLGGAMLISDVVKLLVSRPRPPVEHLQAVTSSSFPSGHATQASAFWLSLVLAAHAARATPLLTRLLTLAAVLLVAAVAASRVYLGVHYPSDVIAGVLLGTGWAVYVVRCVRDATVGRPRQVAR
ncbi:MAG: phosphatase PAP2 family protein [Solirubrobacteraceae bacterium]